MTFPHSAFCLGHLLFAPNLEGGFLTISNGELMHYLNSLPLLQFYMVYSCIYSYRIILSNYFALIQSK